MGILASEPPSAVAAVFFSHPDTAQSGMMGLFKIVSNSGPAIIYKDSSNRKIKGHLHSGLETGASLPATPDSHHTDAGLRKWRRRSVTSCCRISLSQNTFMVSGWIREKKTKG